MCVSRLSVLIARKLCIFFLFLHCVLVYFFTFLFMLCMLPFCVYFVYNFYTNNNNMRCVAP